MKYYNKREIRQIMKKNGYKQIRTSGSHVIYKKGTSTVSIPINSKNISICTINGIFKRYKIEV